MITEFIPAPIYFGLPEKFDRWRPYQDEACFLMLQPSPRFTMAVCPTGFGKSLTYITAAMASEGRSVILTSTKGLQSQLEREFGSVEEIVDIRGRGNYPCRLNTKVNCDTGLCAFGVKCAMRDQGGCTYYDRLRQARRAKIVITNYSYWMAQNEYGEGIGEFQNLILDEAHAAVDHVIDHTSVSFSLSNHTETSFLDLKKKLPQTAEGWKSWAEEKLVDAIVEVGEAKLKRKEKRFLVFSRIQSKLEKLVEYIDRTWVWESNPMAVTLSPIWPRPFTEAVLFLGIPKVILTSATVVPKTADLLGIPRSQMEYREFPHSFPVENRPLIHLPTVRMNYKTGEGEYRILMSRIDSIIESRLQTKGIIHTVSYSRRDMILERSKFKDHMITHQRTNTEAVVRGFKSSPAPMVLVSPSMVTGWDFPGEECRWQIIVKLPYPDTRGTIISARSKGDKDFINYQVVQQLIQATGRGCRSADDFCNTFVIDNNIVWFLQQNNHLLVEWFKGAYRVERGIPEAKQTSDH